MILALFAVLLPQAMWAQTAYAVYCQGEEGTGDAAGTYPDATLYFTYRRELLTAGATFTPAGTTTERTITAVWSGTDVTDSPQGDETIVDGNQYSVRAPWNETCGDVMTKVVIESSFHSVKPKSLCNWFSTATTPFEILSPSGSHLLSIEGLDNLDTSEATSFLGMFSGCWNLGSLDVSTFDTSKAIYLHGMFNRCLNLTTITGLDSWNTENVVDFVALFQGCRSLTNLDGIAHWDLSSALTLSNMFFYCQSLTSLDLSAWDLSNVMSSTKNVVMVKNMYSDGSVKESPLYTPGSLGNMFNECSALVSLNLKGWNIKNVTTIKSLFKNCSSLTSLDLSEWDTSNITDMENLFANMSSLNSLNLSGWKTNNVKNMAGMFLHCHNLTSLDLSGFDTHNVTNMNGMFRYCTSLFSLDLSSFDTHNVTNMNSMFDECNSLTLIELGSFETRNVTTMRNMFTNCYSLSALDLSSFDTHNVTEMQNMFATGSVNNGKQSLTTIYVGVDWNTDNVETSTNMFLRATVLVGGNGTAFSASNPLDKTYAHADVAGNPGYLTLKKPYAVYDAGTHTLYLTGRSDIDASSFTPEAEGAEAITSGLTVMDLAEGNYDLASLMSSNGISASSVTNVVIERSFRTMRPTSCAAWFSGMTNLTDITGEDYLNTSAATSMKDMFKNCSSLTSADLNVGNWKGFDTSSATDMSGMFQGCDNTGFTTLDLNNFATSAVTTMANMFSGCVHLQYSNYTDATDNTAFNLNHFDTSNVTNMSGMFQNCAALTSLDVSNFYTVAISKMNSMFEGCSALTTLDISSFYIPNATTVARMFKDCSSLRIIYAGLTWDASIATSTDMFAGCSTNLKGGSNFTWSADRPTDATYALIDNNEHSGYLTEKYPLALHLYDDRGNMGVIGAYVGQKCVVTVHRDFTPLAWTTLCLPFDMTATQVKNVFGEDAELKTLSAVTRSGSTISALTWTNATSIEAGKPYLIQPTKAINYEEGFTLSSKTISAGAAGNVNNNGFSMCGVFTPTTIAPNSTENVYTLIDNQSIVPTDLATYYNSITGSNTLNGLRAYFTSVKKDYVEVTVSQYKYAVFSCNYDLDFTNVTNANGEPADLTAYIVSAYQPGADAYVSVTSIQNAPANTGLVVKAEKGTYRIPFGKTSVYFKNLLIATAKATPVPYEENGYRNYFLTVQNGSPVFAPVPTAGRTIKAGGAYMPIPVSNISTANAGANIRIVFTDEQNEATSIEGIEENAAKTDGIYYNLNGQRVAAPTKGIYIKDGKKVLVK